MKLLKISTFGVSNGVSPKKPQSCQQLLRSAKVAEVFALYMPKKPDQARRNVQKVEDHRATQTGKGQIMFSPPHAVHCSQQWCFHLAMGFCKDSNPKMSWPTRGPRPTTVHIPTGKPQKHSVSPRKITSYTILGESQRLTLFL